MIEVKTDILLPEPQHRLQIVRRKSESMTFFANCIC